MASPTTQQQQQRTTLEESRFPGWKTNPTQYLSWAVHLALVAESGVLLDLLPPDGVLRAFSPEEEFIMGQSVERLVERMLKLRIKGTVVHLHCTSSTTPEVLYVGVAHAVRIVLQARRDALQQQQSTRAPPRSSLTTTTTQSSGSVVVVPPPPLPVLSLGTPLMRGISEATNTSSLPPPTPATAITIISNTSTIAPTPHTAASSTSAPPPTASSPPNDLLSTSLVIILQDIDRAPLRTIACVTEMLVNKCLSAPPSTTLLVPGSIVDRIDLPTPFVMLATTTAAPMLTTSSTLVSVASDFSLPDRFLDAILLRIPVFLPREAPASGSAALSTDLSFLDFRPAQEAANRVFVSPTIARFMRDVLVSLRTHALVSRGPSTHAYETLLSACRINASLNKRTYVIPLDVELCVVEVLAHRLAVRRELEGGAKKHAHSLARRVVSVVMETLPVLR
jgi:hypothetical protein